MTASLRLTCLDCGSDFWLTSGEREWYECQGFPEPKRCKPCRRSRRYGVTAVSNDPDLAVAATPSTALAPTAPFPEWGQGRYPRRASRVALISVLSLVVLAFVLSAGTFAIAWRLSAQSTATIATTTGVTTTGLNVRAGPTARSVVLTVLEPGTKVMVLSRVLDWYQVDHLGQTGFVRRNFLTLETQMKEVNHAP